MGTGEGKLPYTGCGKSAALKGHGFSHIVIGKEIGVLKGHGFSRAATTAKPTWASAPEGCFWELDTK
jgi:hypothetical protein